MKRGRGAKRSSGSPSGREAQTRPLSAPYAVTCGDCYDLLPKLPANSVDLILTSPPYWGLRDYASDHNWDIGDEWKVAGFSVEEVPPYDWYRSQGGLLGLEPRPEWYVEHVVEILERGRHALKPGGSLWLNVGDTYFARWSSIRPNGRQGLNGDERLRRKVPAGGYRQDKQLLLIPARVAIALQERRWILRNDLIWYKPNLPPRPETDRLRLAHEHLFHFVKRPNRGRAQYHYDIAAVGDPPDDVVEVSVAPGGNGHSATFPAKLIEPRILSSCPLAGTLLDPFCGVGTALRVAVEHGRRAVGFEQNRQFVGAALTSLARCVPPTAAPRRRRG